MSLEWNGEKYLALLEDEARKAIDRSLIVLQTAAKNELNRKASHGGRSASSPGEPPARRTGGLSQSVQIDRTGISDPNPFGRVGTNKEYAKIQEYGGIVKAKRVKALPIPLNYEAERLQKRAGGSVRNIPGLFPLRRLMKGQGESTVLARRVGKQGKLEILFLLKGAVRLPARPWFRPAIASTAAKIQADLDGVAERAIKRMR